MHMGYGLEEIALIHDGEWTSKSTHKQGELKCDKQV